MFVRTIVFIAMFAAGVLILKYTEQVVRTVGKSGWAEQHLGMGGTYNMWKIIAIVVMLFGFLYLIGAIDFFGFTKLAAPEATETPLELQ